MSTRPSWAALVGRRPSLGPEVGAINSRLMGRRRSTVSELIDASRWRVDPVEAQARLAERDAREAADNRSEIERYLGDPGPRSALATAGKQNGIAIPRRSVAGMRVDLFRRR